MAAKAKAPVKKAAPSEPNIPAFGGGSATYEAPVTPGVVAPGTNTSAAENVVQLPASIANQVLVGQGKGTPAVPAKPIDAPERAGANVAESAKQLLTAYKNLFGPVGSLTRDDIKTLKNLKDPALEKAISGVQNLAQGNTATEKPPGWEQTYLGNSPSYTDIKVTPHELATAKSVVAKAIADKVPGLEAGDILAHDPKDVFDIPVSPAMSASFEQEGYSISANTTLGNAITAINPSGFFKAQGAKSKNTPAVPAQSPQTAQEWVTAAINEYTAASKGTTTADKTQAADIVKTLVQAGVLKTDSPTAQDIATAYSTVATQAVQQKVTPEALLATGQKQVEANNPNLGTANTSDQAAEIANTADRLGVTLSPAQQNYLTAQADQFASSSGSVGWSQAQIDQAVSGYFTFPTNAQGQPDPTQLSGDAASIYQGLKKIADDYQIPISATGPKGLASWVSNAISGINDSGQVDTTTDLTSGAGASEASFTQYAQQVAASLYPQFATQINKGIATTTLLDPYAQVAASVLGFGNVAGTSASTSEADDATASLGIDWSLPKWQVALQGSRDPATGQPIPMTLDQWRSTLITDPQYGWDKTDDAKNAAMGVADHLLSVFGQPAATGQ